MYKVSLHLHAKPAIARALKVHVIQLSYIHTPAQTTTNRKHCPNPKPHLPFNQLIVSLISTDAVQVAPWSGIHSLKETPNPSPSMPLIVRDWWNCLLWPSTRSQNQLPLGSLCYLGSPCLTPCLLTVSSTLHGYKLCNWNYATTTHSMQTHNSQPWPPSTCSWVHVCVVSNARSCHWTTGTHDRITRSWQECTFLSAARAFLTGNSRFPGNSRASGNSRGSGIPVVREFPAAREFPVPREFPFPGNSRFPGIPAAREFPKPREFP